MPPTRSPLQIIINIHFMKGSITCSIKSEESEESDKNVNKYFLHESYHQTWGVYIRLRVST
jgi:hypothetical protein